MPSPQKSVEETKKSSINESYRIVYYERTQHTYEVRAENRDEIDDNYAEDLEVLHEDTEYIDSDREEVERFLSPDEDRDRLEAHKAWRENPKEGEKFCIKECAVEYGATITEEYDGAEFVECAFEHAKFIGVNFETINVAGSRFAMCSVKDCTGLEEREIAKPGSLWFKKDRDWDSKEEGVAYKYTPLIIKKWATYHTKKSPQTVAIHLEYLLNNRMQTLATIPSNFYKELPCKEDSK